MPAIHAGMTEFRFSFFVSERKIMNHSVVKGLLLFWLRFRRTASTSG
jgi:hypothetical protein